MSQTLSGFSDHAFLLAEGKSDIFLAKVTILRAVEGGNRNADYFVFMSQLVGKGVILGSLVSVLIDHVLLHDFYSRDICQHEISTLGDPDVNVEG